MLKLKKLEKDVFDNFVLNHPTKSHFLQSAEWGEFCKVEKHLTPYYLGLVNDDDKIEATVLLLQKHLPFNLSYFYAPRGFVLDYTNKELFKTMTKKVIEFAKKKKAIFIKIDPDIIFRSYNYLSEENKLEVNGNDLYNYFKEVGWKHLGFTKNFETMQPRYTFRINLNQSLEDIENHFSKTTKQRITKSQKLETEVKIGTESDLDDFYNLMMLTENRKDFVSYNKEYYNTLYEIFNGNKNTKAVLFLGKIDFKKTLNTLDNNLKNINNQISIMPIDNLSKSAKNKLNELQKQRENIIGTKEQEGTLAYYECEAQYINEKLLDDYQNIVHKRGQLVRQLYETKKALTDIYQDIYSPVVGEISTLLGDLEDNISFQAEIRLMDTAFDENALHYINLK